MKKTLLILSIFSFGLLLVGQGCTRGLSQEKQKAIQPVELEYWTVFNNMEMLRQFAREFEQRRGKYVDVKIRKVRFDEFNKLFLEALADDVAPDIVSMHNRWLRKQKERLAPMPRQVRVANLRVEGRFSKSKNVSFVNQVLPRPTDIERGYLQAVSEDVIMDDKAYGLPLAFDTLALYYNKDLLDRAGVPQPPTSWSELQEAVKATTKYDSEGNIVQSGIAMGTSENMNNFFDILSVLMMQNGTRMAQNGRVTFANEIRQNTENHPTLQALRFFTDFAREERDVYSWNSEKPNALEEFVRGNTVFYIGFAHNGQEIRQRAPDMNLGTVPLPQLNPSSPVNTANYWVETVVKDSQHKNLAWSFIRYMTRPENIKRYVEATKQPTPLRAQIESQKEDVKVEPFLTNILTARNWYKGKDIKATREAFADLIESYKRPYPEDVDPNERDAELISNTARKVQQTMR